MQWYSVVKGEKLGLYTGNLESAYVSPRHVFGGDNLYLESLQHPFPPYQSWSSIQFLFWFPFWRA